MNGNETEGKLTWKRLKKKKKKQRIFKPSIIYWGILQIYSSDFFTIKPKWFKYGMFKVALKRNNLKW